MSIIVNTHGHANLRGCHHVNSSLVTLKNFKYLAEKTGGE